MSIIIFSKPITLTPAVTTASITIKRIIDIQEESKVIARIKELPDPLILWEGSDYDAIGDWKQADAEARIKELLSK